ncbi:MAG: hypothetical protein ACI8QC_001451 [Planctomycetota bacterium]|jgi:hypothetical protein
MRALPIVAALVASLSIQSAAAQDGTLTFPLTTIAAEMSVSGLVMDPDLEAIANLDNFQSVILTDMLLPSGDVVDLELRRISVERCKFGFQVNGEPAGDLLAGLDLSVWKGSVVGLPKSDVMLSFSTHGSRGWIHMGSELVHLMPRPDASGDWGSGDVLVATERAMNAAGNALDSDCATLPPANPPIAGQLGAMLDGGGTITTNSVVDTCSLRECTIAMETDWQYYQLFNDLNAATTYITTLLSYVSNRYEIQASTVLTFPYLQLYTTSNDPWDTPDNGGNSIDMLYEFRAAWLGNVPMGATLGHMMSGAGLGGGVAWLDVLCNNSYNFGVSGNIGAQCQFPVVQQPSNWDFMVVAHELGHNFASPHTHSFCPPLDECAPAGYFGQCQTQQTCTNMGTIMSYCHLCSGGTANITTYFHPEVGAVMTAASAACNPALFEVQVNRPESLLDSSTTPTSLQVLSGAVVAPVSVHYRFNQAGAYTALAMTDQGGGHFTADLPMGICGDTAELYYSYEVGAMGNFTCPADAPNEVFDANVGTLVDSHTDDFETNTGWTTSNQGATGGEWERGVPVDDAGWAYDPAADYDGSGSCYLTENQVGNTDVDGGDVTLNSPALDLSDPTSRLSYAYFLRLSNSDGSDRILVEASTGGAWFEVARHDTDGGLAWRTHAITHGDMLAAGLVPTATTLVRFNVDDGGSPSIVEAALDAIAISTTVPCGSFGTNYCGPAAVNTTGQPGIMSGSGSLVASDNNLTLVASQLPPNEFGIFITSPTQGFIANPGGSDGNLCLGGNIGRYNAAAGYGVLDSGAGGSFSLSPDLTNTPTPSGPLSVMSGETHNFQAWYRDFVGGMPTSNFTDGLSLTFQ